MNDQPIFSRKQSQKSRLFGDDWHRELSEAARLLAVGDPESLDIVEQSLKHHNPIIRGAAIEILAEINLPQATSLLTKALSDDDPKLRLMAAQILQLTQSQGGDLPDETLAHIQTLVDSETQYQRLWTPEVKTRYRRGKFWFGNLGILATVFAAVMLLIDSNGLRLPFILCSVLAASSFLGRAGMERCDRRGYGYAIFASLVLLTGFPIFTIGGIWLLKSLMKPDLTAVFQQP